MEFVLEGMLLLLVPLIGIGLLTVAYRQRERYTRWYSRLFLLSAAAADIWQLLLMTIGFFDGFEDLFAYFHTYGYDEAILRPYRLLLGWLYAAVLLGLLGVVVLALQVTLRRRRWSAVALRAVIGCVLLLYLLSFAMDLAFWSRYGRPASLINWMVPFTCLYAYGMSGIGDTGERRFSLLPVMLLGACLLDIARLGVWVYPQKVWAGWAGWGYPLIEIAVTALYIPTHWPRASSRESA